MKKLILILTLGLICFLPSCTPSGYMPSPFGDIAEIRLQRDRIFTGELLTVTDSIIYVLNNKNIFAIRNNKMSEVYFEKYKDDNSWIIGVLLGEVLPAVAISIVAGSYSDGFAPVLAVSLVPAVVSTSLFILTSPKTSYDDLQERQGIYELNKFARYPGGLTDRQFKDLLNFYGKDSCIYLN